MQERTKKYLFAGGGTGGHLFPALAIADEIKKFQPDAEILFVGTKNKIEARVVPQKGYNFRAIWISGFQRNMRFENLLFPIKLIVSMIQSINILKKFKPDVVIGTGGYVCGPVLYTASMLGLNTVIHESNSLPGAVTRFLAGRMSKVFLTFEETKKYFKRIDNAEVTGNPTRGVLENINTQDALKFFGFSDNKKTLLIFGGSLGSASINNAVLRILKNLLQSGVQVIWQTGEQDFDRVKNELSNNNVDSSQCLWLGKFIDRMEMAYSLADVVVCRAGATTLAELTRLGKASVLIPYPHAAADHQTVNAQTLVKTGAALMIKDNELSENVEKYVMNLLQNEDARQAIAGNCKKFGHPEAAYNLATKIIAMVK